MCVQIIAKTLYSDHLVMM